MPAPRIPIERAHRIKAAIEQSLRDGYQPKGESGGRGSCVTEAIRRLQEAGHRETRNTVGAFLRLHEKLAARGDDHLLPDWSLYARPGIEPGKIRRGRVERWLLTAAQDDTDIHPRFWTNLQAYASYLRAEIVVGGFTYQQRRHTDRETLTGTFRAEVRPFLRFDPMDCGTVLFCANMNTLPTAVRPLSGLTTFSRGRDAVFPHAKLAYQTVPQMRGSYVPSIMTTGACTVPNYIEKKAGVKAEFHHVLGATLVEVDGTGGAWCRQISAARDGSFQDLDRVVADGKVTAGARVKAITWGDIHLPTVEESVFHHLWAPHADSMIDALRPQCQFMHDLLSFEMASRHVDGDPFHRARMVHRNMAGMRAHVAEGVAFLREASRPTCQTHVVVSNHDDRLLQWSRKDADRQDVENVVYWHECNLAVHQAIADGVDDFDLFTWALRREDPQGLPDIEIVPIGGSVVICQDTGGIECGAHGHEGPNGSRGTVIGLSRMGTRITIGDKHSPEILDGVYVAGITGSLDQGYNTGPGSWRRAHVVTYPNGKRTIITQAEDGRWRA